MFASSWTDGSAAMASTSRMHPDQRPTARLPFSRNGNIESWSPMTLTFVRMLRRRDPVVGVEAAVAQGAVIGRA